MLTGHFVGFACSGSFVLDNKRDLKCRLQTSYQVRGDIYKYFVNAIINATCIVVDLSHLL